MAASPSPAPRGAVVLVLLSLARASPGLASTVVEAEVWCLALLLAAEQLWVLVMAVYVPVGAGCHWAPCPLQAHGEVAASLLQGPACAAFHRSCDVQLLTRAFLLS